MDTHKTRPIRKDTVLLPIIKIYKQTKQATTGNWLRRQLHACIHLYIHM